MINNRADTQRLMDYFRVHDETRRREIEQALNEFDQLPGVFSAVCDFQTDQFIYVSENVSYLLGYSVDKLLKEGFYFFFRLIPENVIPSILAQQQEYYKIFASPEFDYTQSFLMQFNGAFNCANKDILEMKQIVVVLEFEAGGDVRNFFGIWIKSSNGKIAGIRMPELQQKLRDFHALLFAPGSASKQSENKSELVTIKTPVFSKPRLTKKEKELLSLLSQGLALKEISKKLKTSYFTSETHRKNLFVKFEVKNVAELIKKASKIYWFE